MSTDTLTDVTAGATTGETAPAADGTRSEGWGIAYASVALLVLGVFAAYGFNAAENARAEAESAACHVMASTWPMYATAYAGLLATLAATALAGRRLLQPLRPRGPVQMAGMALPAALLLLVLQGVIVWTLHQPTGGPVDCLG
ncbi:hypothetical protein [Streptomyces sp. NPDC000618]|uniref:hypothetical protein n=1 Tax=Streptomyces sp. NPDC000618 TaxID=3154265 RepID=UPI00332B65FB